MSIIVWLFLIASAAVVSSQSSMNCSIYPRVSVPGDMVPLINLYQGNDSHAEYANLTNYAYTVACKSTITTIGNSCSGNYVNIAQLYNYTDSHVSVNDYYSRKVCFSAPAGYAWQYGTSAVGATPADYECMFSIFDYQDAHVYDCDNTNASYNVNLRLYRPCVNLSDPSTYGTKVVNNSDNIWVNENITLCTDSYWVNDTGVSGAIIINASDITLDCDDSMIWSDFPSFTSLGISADGYDGVTLIDCNVSGYAAAVSLQGSDDSNLSGINTWNNTYYGILVYESDRADISDVRTWNHSRVFSGYGIRIERSENCSLSDIYAWDNRVGVDFSASNRSNLTSSIIFDNDRGVYLETTSILNNISYVWARNNTVGGFIISAGCSNNTLYFNNATNHSQDGFETSANYTYFIGNIAENNTGYGFQSSYNDKSVFDSNRALNNSWAGFRFEQVNFTDLINNTAADNSQDGFEFSVLRNGTIDGCTAYGNTNGGYDLATVTNTTINNSIAYSNAGGFSGSNSFADNILENLTAYSNTGSGVQSSGFSSSRNTFRHIIAYNNWYGLYVAGSDNILNNITGYGNAYRGLTVYAANNTQVTDSVLYNNGYDLYIDNSFGSDVWLNMSNIRFTNPSGSMLNLTNISIDDRGTAESYSINWSSFSTLPADRLSFMNKSVNITSQGGSPSIDIIVWHWTDSEAASYDEAELELWKYNNTDGWTIISNTPDTADNLLTIMGLIPESDYAIMEEQPAGCYDTDGDGAYNTSSEVSCAGYRDCDDYNATYLPPRDEFNITATTTLCPGTFYLNDSAGPGLVRINESTGSIICNQTVMIGNDSGIGISAIADSNVSFCDVRNYSIGLLVNDTAVFILNTSSISDCSGQALYINRSAGSIIFNSSFTGSVDSGIFFEDSDNCDVYNSTFTGNAYGVRLDAGSAGNLFYYNSFISSSTLHAYAGNAGNHFNTTNTTVSCPGGNWALCARGNYWDDILLVDLYDSNADGFGDIGAEYPYNATYSSRVSANVTDYGPITTKQSPGIPPSGSIVIYGPNGTVWTGTRSVFLNLSFEAPEGVAGCRWANDNPASLNNYPLEECTTVKAWLLSEGEGNKTVYYEIVDLDSNNVVLEDSILYYYTQDYTAPTAPTVYDGRKGIDADDIDWWNRNDTLNAWWFNATEDISTVYYRYRVLNNSLCSGSCAWTEAGMNTSITITGLNLSEGRNYSVEVMAYNPFGMNATAASDGVRIDFTRPDVPIINSSTHPSQVIYYQSSTARFNWSASDPLSSGVSSGIAGYSWLLDVHPGTAPDSVMDGRDWELLSGLHKGVYNQTLRTNGSGGEVAYAVFSEIDSNFTVGDKLRVKVTLAEQGSDYGDLMGVMVYLMRTNAVGATINNFDYGTPISDIANVSWDIRYAETMGLAGDYTFNLTVNETVLNSSYDMYLVVKGIPSDDDNRNPLTMSGTTSEYLIDNSTKNWVCDDSNNCHQNTTTLDYAISVEREDSGDWSEMYEYLGDGGYYFHVRAKDRAGNWGDPAHYRILVAAGGVSSIIYSPVDGEVFAVNGTERNITVRVSVTGNASTWVVAKQGAIIFTSYKQDCNSTCWFGNVTLQAGRSELYAMTNTSAGAAAKSPGIYVLVSSDFIPITNKTLRVKYTAGNTMGGGEISYQSGSYYAGVANEDPAGIGTDYIQADTRYNSMKLFVTKPFDTAAVGSRLYQNSFMDQVMPMFGLKRSTVDYIIRTELRYPDIYLGGDFSLPPGVYQIYMRKTGIDEHGRYNVTFVIG